MWTLSDSTTISHDAGTITGSSELAARLRAERAAAAQGLEIWVQLAAEPGAPQLLDTADVACVNVWVRQLARLAGVTVLSAPHITAMGGGGGARDAIY